MKNNWIDAGILQERFQAFFFQIQLWMVEAACLEPFSPMLLLLVEKMV